MKEKKRDNKKKTVSKKKGKSIGGHKVKYQTEHLNKGFQGFLNEKVSIAQAHKEKQTRIKQNISDGTSKIKSVQNKDPVNLNMFTELFAVMK